VPPPTSRCGCSTPGWRGAAGAWLAPLFFIACAVSRRRAR
jgi:hypothetical protein